MGFFDLFKKPAGNIADTFTTKLKSPFFATFLLVWIIRNKIFIYDLFFNDSKIDKTYILKDNLNYAELTFWYQLLITFLLTLVILLLYYLFLNLSRLLTVASEDNLKLIVYKVFSSKRFVDRNRHNQLKIEFDKVFQKNIGLEKSNSDYREVKAVDDAKYSSIEIDFDTVRRDRDKLILEKEEQRKTLEDFSQNKLKDKKELDKLQKSIVVSTRDLKDLEVTLEELNTKIVNLEEKNIHSKKQITTLESQVNTNRGKEYYSKLDMYFVKLRGFIDKAIEPKSDSTIDKQKAAGVKRRINKYLITIANNIKNIK